MAAGLPAIWRNIPERYNLMGSRCATCGTVYFPSMKICQRCRRTGKLEDHQLLGQGEVYSYSTVDVPPEGFEFETPYVIALIKLVEGPIVTAQIVDCRPDRVKEGMKVEIAFRKISEDGKGGIIHYGYAFRPMRNHNHQSSA